ncbi:MAG TPA: alpha/beta hydrolase [Polyangiaceae bacterium]|nr:alpha/beta hydrolase [Polyangiaceae bacterium]
MVIGTFRPHPLPKMVASRFAALGLVGWLVTACGSDAQSAATPRTRSPEAGTVLLDAGDTSEDGSSTDAIRKIQIPVKDFVFDAYEAGPETGVAVFLLHGFPETGWEWRNQLRALAKAGFHAVAPDQRGYSAGARPPAVSDYTVLALMQDVTGMADALHIDSFHLAGHDWGGGVGWGLAKLSPRVLSYTAVSTPHPDALKEKLSDASSCQHRDSAYFDTFTQPDAATLFLAGDAGVLRAAFPGVAAEDVDVYVKALGTPDAMNAALNWYRANIQNRNFTTPDVGSVTIPVTYVFGDADAYFCLDTAQATANFVSGPYRFVQLAGVSHWVPEAAPDAVSTAILDRIRGTDGG